MESILDSIKKLLGIESSYTEFDIDIIILINSAFSTLQQLGVGPVEGFEIEDKTTTWDAFTSGNTNLNSAKQYVYLKVRTTFDPPSTSALLESMNQMIKELEWRLNVVAENTVYGVTLVVDGVIDGGTP